MSEEAGWSFQYAVKFLCISVRDFGTTLETASVLPGNYRTLVNIHNPHDHAIKYRMKLAIGDIDQFISPFVPGELGPDGMTRVDCPQIREGFFDSPPAPHGISEGFLVIESTHGLDVVAVYTAGGPKWVRTLDVHHVRARRLGGTSECRGQHVADFRNEAPGTRPNPLTVDGVLKFFRTQPPAGPLAIEAIGSHTGLNCGNLLEVTFGVSVTSVVMVLVHFGTPATVVATNPGGAPVDGPIMMGPMQNSPETISLAAPDIDTVSVRSPDNEVLMLCLAAS